MDTDFSSRWFGVRSVFLHSGGMYEERVIAVAANDLDEAIRRGELEGAEYANVLGIEQLGLVQAFAMYDDLVDGAEVFSLVRQSPLEQEVYLTQFFDTGTERQKDTTDE